MRGRTVLLVANNFPPVHGGSAVVYGNLARFAEGRLVPLAPRRSYLDGLPLIGWREHDRRAPYRVVRLTLLRTLIGPEPARSPLRRLRFLLGDMALRAHVATVLLRRIVGLRAGALCIGELVASGWIIHAFRWIPGLRIVVYVHGEEITTVDPYDRAGARRRRALLAADGIVVVSRFTLDAVRRLLGPAAPDNIRLIENGVDTLRFSPRSRRRDLIELYRLDGCFVFVSVCRLLEKKGLDHAIQAFARVCAIHPDCRYLIVGSGPYRAALEHLAASPGIAGRVVFAGEVADDELADFYCLGDVFVMPNRELANGDTEGFGLVFLEANSCGLPVIAGRDGGSTDAVRDGINGLVVDGRSVEQIADAMLSLHDDAALRSAIGERGRTVAEQAGWAAKTEAFLQFCLGATPSDAAAPPKQTG